MANLSGVTTNYFPVASETFSDNLTNTITALATTVQINNMTQYADGDVVVLTVEPGTANQATFIGVKQSSPTRVISCVWTEGNTAVGHNSGATVVDYDSATHYDAVTKGIRQFANQDGTLKTSAVQAALNISSAVPPDYTTLATVPGTILNNGQRSSTLTFPNVDYTDRLQPKTRLRVTRSVAAPVQCTSLNGTNQYYNRTTTINGHTFTDDFVAGGWVKLASYPSSRGAIISRRNGTNGWSLDVDSNGKLILYGLNGSASNYSQILSYQAIPLGRWVHVAAQIDMSAFTATSTTSYIMFDGISIPIELNRGGTNPISIIQGGDINVGANQSSTSFFPGKIAQTFVSSAKITQANICALMNQGLTAALISANNIASAYSMNNDLNDLNTTNANNLTAQGSAVATNADSPFGIQDNGTNSSSIEHLIIHKATLVGSDTVCLAQSPEGGAIPTTGGISAAAYSSADVPFGFPSQKDRWQLKMLLLSTVANPGGAGSLTIYNAGGLNLYVPIGTWDLKGELAYDTNPNGTTAQIYAGLSSSPTAWSDKDLSEIWFQNGLSAGSLNAHKFTVGKTIQLTTAANYYPLQASGVALNSVGNLRGSASSTTPEYSLIQVDNAYL